ncbi:MAG: M23 family metallopeptidase [Chloroflexi bacterium]|nr:M23 family metallopeptidase [Chloroflexota bacterium]
MSEFKFEAWPTEFRSINQYFGANPQNYAQFGLPGHEGIDVMAPSGSKIFAVADGTVNMVRTNPKGHNYGVHVRIDHEDGWQTIYAHLQQALVNSGQQVKAGQAIGLADNTGNSFGSHLHLTLKKKNESHQNWPYNIFDPTSYLLPLIGFTRPAGPYTDGWAYTNGIFTVGNLTQAAAGGINLRETPSINGHQIDLVPGGTIMIVSGSPRGQYTPVKVATVTLSNVPQPPPAQPTPPPASSDSSIAGWAFANYLTRRGNQGIVGQFGINLRTAPNRTAQNIGLVTGSSTATITGSQQGEYLPVTVRRTDFTGPINDPGGTVTPSPQPTPVTPPADTILGWAFSQNLTVDGNQITSGRYGTNLRARPSRDGAPLGLFIEGGRALLAGKPIGEYTPVFVKRSFLQNLISNLPPIQQPETLADSSPPPSPAPLPDTTPGWAFSTAMNSGGGMATAGQFGINLRDTPRRNAQNIGFVPAGASMIITGAAQGEYTPVRVDDDIIRDPFTPSKPVTDTTAKPDEVSPEPTPLGNTAIGLHASADPDISSAEIAEFKALRPGIIKALSFHNPDGVRKLVQNHPRARWIVRAFLSFGGRHISPQQFLNDTISDVRRTLNIIGNKDVVVELHNEPNLTVEGMGSTWRNGAEFNRWFLEVLRLYRQAIPNMRFIYPGLSPGASVRNIKMDHVEFIEASRDAVKAADGLGIHLYWSNVYPMSLALNVLDDYIARFRFKPIWVTEASNNKAGTAVHRKAAEYLQFWQELQKRPTVQGVTYFVASASNSEFKEEIWVGRNIGAMVGRR